MSTPKVAIVCDWLTNMGGAERVVLALHKAFPEAPIFTSVFDPKACPAFASLDIRTTYLQKLPASLRKRHQLFPLLRANAFRRLDLSAYDIVVSSASAEAKAIRVRSDAIHICYCHTPTRYYWSHYKEYLAEPGFGPFNPAIRLALPSLVHIMRRGDLQAVSGVDYFIANSSTVASRIATYYERDDATIIYPPIDMQRFRNLDISGPRSGYVVVGRQVPYKRMDLAVAACSQLNAPLTVYGDGPMHEKLVRMAGPTVTFVVGASDEEVARGFAKAKGFIFPQEDDFGIVQIEAMAAGTPVIAYAKGGAFDAVIENKTGIFFEKQQVEDLVKAIQEFEAKRFSPKVIQAHAELFNETHFITKIRDFVAEKYAAKNHRTRSHTH